VSFFFIFVSQTELEPRKPEADAAVSSVV
jgi:hypothetical protein